MKLVVQIVLPDCHDIGAIDSHGIAVGLEWVRAVAATKFGAES